MPHINSDLPAFADNTPVTRADLRRLVMGLTGLSGDVANKYVQGGTYPATSRFVIEVFPAKIESQYQESLGNTVPTAQYNMTRTVTKEGSSQTALWATRTENIPGIALDFVATNYAELDPDGNPTGNSLSAGQQVLIFAVWNRDQVTVNASGTPTTKTVNTKFYVFYFEPTFPATAKIISNVSGAAGKYNGTIYAIPTTDDGTGDLTLPDGLTVGASCLVIYTQEDSANGTATATHRLEIGSYPVGTYGGMSEETPPRPTIIIGSGRGRKDSPTVLNDNTGGGVDALADTWSRETNGTPVDEWRMTRVFWDTGADILYGYLRMYSYDACGVHYATSAETRYIIDSSSACPP